MKELKCPKCGSVFTVDESDYADIVSQVKNAEFQAELDRRLKEFEKRQTVQQQADELKAEQRLQAKQLEFTQQLAAKDTEIAKLKAGLAEGEAKIRVAVLEEQNKSKDELQKKEQKIAQLQNEMTSKESEAQARVITLKEMYDMQLAKKPVAVEVRMSETQDRGGRYDVLLITADGEEMEVMFRDRPARLIYIYTLMHPEGFQRRSLTANNYQKLCDLYSKLYFASAEPMLKSIEKLGFDQYINQAVTQSRVAIRNTIGSATEFEIARPQRNGGRTLVTFAAKGGNVIIDNSLL